MLTKLGIPTLAAIAMLGAMGAPPAKAGVHFGVRIGGPVYTYPAPVYPVAPDPYAYPYSTPYYSTPYAYPYGGYYWGGDHDRDDRGRFERHERDSRGHDGGFRGHDDHRR